MRSQIITIRELIMPELTENFFSQQRQAIAAQLKQAIQDNHLERVNQCIAVDHSIVNESLDDDSQKPLHYAVLSNNQSITAALLNANADIDCIDGLANTPLILAIELGYCDLAYWLMDKGAHPNKPEGAYQKSLHIAVMQGYDEMVRTLVAHEEIDLDAQDAIGQTALHVVCPSEQEGSTITQILLDKGSNPNMRDNEGKFPLDIAYEEQAFERIRLLESNDALSRNMIAREQAESPYPDSSDSSSSYDSDPNDPINIELPPVKRQRFT